MRHESNIRCMDAYGFYERTLLWVYNGVYNNEWKGLDDMYTIKIKVDNIRVKENIIRLLKFVNYKGSSVVKACRSDTEEIEVDFVEGNIKRMTIKHESLEID